MGQQLFITKEAMLAAGASLVREDKEVFYDENGEIEWSYDYSVWDIPLSGEWPELWYSYNKDSFCIDCNPWGSNYGVIMPWVLDNNVPHSFV